MLRAHNPLSETLGDNLCFPVLERYINPIITVRSKLSPTAALCISPIIALCNQIHFYISRAKKI